MKKLLFIFGLFYFELTAFAGGPIDPSEIIRVGESRLRGDSTQAVMEMIIKKPDFTRKLKIRSWTVRNEKALVEILEPAKEEGISSLRVGDQMWNYLPKSDQVVRVPTSLMLQSWMGSDFTNDDLMKSSSFVRDYRHRVTKIGMKGREKVIVIECQPKPGAPVVWGKILYTARASDWLPVSQRYFDEKGKWVRTLEFERFENQDGRIVPTIARVRVADSKQQTTTIHYKKVLYDRAIDEALFDRDFLRRTVENGKNLAQGWSLKPLPGRNVAAAGPPPLASAKVTAKAAAQRSLPKSARRAATSRRRPSKAVWSSMGGVGAP